MIPDLRHTDFAHELSELRAIRAESMGWTPLEPGAYLHRGAQPGSAEEALVVVVGVPDANLAGLNVLWFT